MKNQSPPGTETAEGIFSDSILPAAELGHKPHLFRNGKVVGLGGGSGNAMIKFIHNPITDQM
jgi:hypothetical protein